MEELGVGIAVHINDDVIVLFVAVDDVHEEERLALHLLLHLLACLAVHQVNLDLRRSGVK